MLRSALGMVVPVLGMLVLVPMVRGRGAALAVDPPRVAAAIVFFFPNRNTVFDFIDDVSAGVERFAAMGGTHAYPNGHVGEVERTDAMDAQRVLDGETLQCLRENSLT